MVSFESQTRTAFFKLPFTRITILPVKPTSLHLANKHSGTLLVFPRAGCILQQGEDFLDGP